MEKMICIPVWRYELMLKTFDEAMKELEELKRALSEILQKDQVYIERLYPFEDAGKVQVIRASGQLLEEEYTPEGIAVKAYVPKEIYLSGRV